MRRSLTAAILFIGVLSASAQRTAVDTHTTVFDDRVKTLKLTVGDSTTPRVGTPVLALSTGDYLTIAFDRLEEERTYFRYELIHCDVNWQPDNLAYVEYLDGFNEAQIEDYAFSEATNTHYIHYTFALPNEGMMPTISGNYLIRVYEESQPDVTVFQARFTMSEQTAILSSSVTSRTDVDSNREHQQLSVSANVERSSVTDIFNDITLVIEQNGRIDNQSVLTKPLRVSGRTLIYEHQPELVFNAGNVYRRFESVSVTYPGMHIEENAWHAPYYHTILETDKSRARYTYNYDHNLAGAYVVREYNSDDSDVQADYTVVHFSLDYPETPGYEFYVEGDFTQRRFSDECKMRYNHERERYELAMLLKQGSYSYQYLAVPVNGATRGRTDVIEGDKYETQNTYRIFLYNRRPGERYDRLIGVSEITSE
jgi:hypothetical protein